MSRRTSDFARSSRIGLTAGLLIAACLAQAADGDAAKPPPAKTSVPITAPASIADMLAAADAAAKERRWPAAIAGWQAVLAREPGRNELRRRLADALFENGRGIESRAEYERLIRERPDADIQFRLIGLLREAGANIAALRLAEQSQTSFPGDARFLPLRVDLLLSLGDQAGADKLAGTLPASREGQMSEGRLAEAGEHWAAAWRAYRRAAAAGAGKPAEEGLQRCQRQAIHLGRWWVFAAPGWQAMPAQSTFRQRLQGVEIQLAAAPAGNPAEALQSALSARLPRDLLTPPAPPEVLAAFAAQSADHQAGKGEHTNASEADHQAVLKALQAPFEITTDALAPGQALCARAAPRQEVDASAMPTPITACIPPENGLIYVLTAKMDVATARQWLRQAIAAGRVEE